VTPAEQAELLPIDADHDPHRWLENVTGEDALAWVEQRNAATVRDHARTPLFEELRAEILAVLDADTRIPYVVRRGEHLYNFWQDERHPRGRWRRTSLASYRGTEPDWETVLDLDALAETEGENWVWRGADFLEPDRRRCLLSLSRGGADASVVREFDVLDKTFVADGFALAEAKSASGWIDADTLYVGTDLGPGSMTESGYPRVLRRWRRGTPLSDAPVIYAGDHDDLSVSAWHDPTAGYRRDFVARNRDFYRSELYLLRDGEPTRIDTPDDAITSVHRDWLLIETRSAWTVGDRGYPAGALLAARFDDFLAGAREFTVLFEPDPRSALGWYHWTRDHLLISTLTDVRSQVSVLTPAPGGWARAELTAVPEWSSVNVISTDRRHGNEFWLAVDGYLRPPALLRGVAGTAEPVEPVKTSPSFFDTAGLTVEQRFATSPDGTAVPYFVIGPDTKAPRPTLLSGYGGFEVSLLPRYDGADGRGWLARGGVYVVANIRGGGEYGPGWHQSVLRENRPLAYADFAAVARDLVERGTTTPELLGIRGGSNGGLLMGNMLTGYPELFGAIVAQVPLLDMRRYHRLLAGASWMAEYGDPDDPADWAFLRGFSPYHQLAPGRPYPPTLLTTSTRDDRVHPGHARKMVARLRALGYPVSYYENTEGGHGGAANNEQTAFVEALCFSFLWSAVGGTAPPSGA
jgi:prolyl oligopeptidase